MLCFDPSTSINEATTGGLVVVEDGFSQTLNPNFSPDFSISAPSAHHHHQSQHQHQPRLEDGLAAALSMDYQQKLNLEMEHCYHCITNPNTNQICTHLMQDMPNQGLSCVESNWEDMNLCHQQDQQNIMQMDIQNMQSSNPYPPTHDLLNMLPFQRTSPSSLLPNSSSLSFDGGSSSGTHHHQGSGFLTSLGLLSEHHHLPSDHHQGGVSFDPLLPVNLPPQQPPLLRELMQNYNTRNHHGSLFSGVVDDQRSDGFYQENDQIGRGYENGVFEFNADMNCIAKGRELKGGKHYTTERQRRVQLNGKFEDLKKLVPNPSKSDRASVLKDAIDYINELKMRVAELKILVSKKRSTKERLKRQNVGDSSCNDNNASVVKNEDHHDAMDGSSASALRSSWIHRKSKNTEIDVRIIDDEVTVKLVQQKKINCLLYVSKVLDELQLDLHHVAGGLIGDYYSFLLNSKISEGSIVHTQAIANRLIEVVDKQYAAVQPTASF